MANPRAPCRKEMIEKKTFAARINSTGIDSTKISIFVLGPFHPPPDSATPSG